MLLCPIDGTGLVPLPSEREGRAVRPDPGPTPTVVTMADAAKTYPAARWLSAPWRQLLGDSVPATGWSALVYGVPGSGKSTCLLALIALAVLMGQRVLLLDAEMRVGPALAAILKSSRVPRSLHSRIRVAAVNGVTHIDDLLAAERPGLAVVDSLMPIAAEPGDLARWRGAVPALIAVLHVTKAGGARGDSRFLHDTDAVVRFGDGGACTEKSRFGAVPGTRVEFEDLLWHEPASPDDREAHPVLPLHPSRGARHE